MIRDDIINGYFKWLCDWVYTGRFPEQISYNKLLKHLHKTEFIYFIKMDKNRAADGIELRRRYAIEKGFDATPDCLCGPCSVLEMMVALAIRCEETIMDNPSVGNRTGQWFWKMVSNLGLNSMTDDTYDFQFVEDSLFRFLRRDYEPDGTGGLFVLRHCKHDLRKIEIWVQLLWYLDSVI